MSKIKNKDTKPKRLPPHTIKRTMLGMAQALIKEQQEEPYCPVCGATLQKNHKLLK